MRNLSPKDDRNPTSLRSLASSIFRSGTPFHLFAFQLFAFQLFAQRAPASPHASSDKEVDTFRARSTAPHKAKRWER